MLSRRILFPTALCLALFARPESSACAAEAEPTPEARAHFKRGLELLKSERHEEALRELRAAYAITPKWTALISIGIASEGLERDGEAIDAYQKYLDDGGAGTRKATVVRRSLERLRAGVATVTLEAPGQFWIVDTRTDAGEHVANEYGPFEDRTELRLRGGAHELQLARASFEAPAWHATLLAGDAASHSFEKKREPAPSVIETFGSEPAGEASAVEADIPSATHTTSYVLWGAGAVGAIATSVLLLEGNGAQNRADDDYARRCPLGSVTVDCTGSTRDDEKAANWRTAALVTGIGSLGAVVGGTILYLLDEPSSPGGGATEASLQPWVSPTGIGISGAF